jgi:hypothetical protein
LALQSSMLSADKKYSKKENSDFYFNWIMRIYKVIMMSLCKTYFRAKNLFTKYLLKFIFFFLKIYEKVKANVNPKWLYTMNEN